MVLEAVQFQGCDESGWLRFKSSKAGGLRNCEPGHPCGHLGGHRIVQSDGSTRV